MKLRTRLFLWISSIFFVFFIVTYFFENSEIRKNLYQAQKRIKNEIHEEKVEGNVHLEDFLSIVVSDYLGEIDSLLYHIEKDPELNHQFSPTFVNENQMSWNSAAEILLQNKWMNFFQHTIDGKGSSVITPSFKDLEKVHRYWIDQDLSWVFHGQKAYIGICLPIETLEEKIDIRKTDLFYLFDWEMLVEKQQYFEQILQRVHSQSKSLLSLMNLCQEKLLKAIQYLSYNQSDLQGKSSNEIKDWLMRKKIKRPKSWKYKKHTQKIYQEKNIAKSQQIKQDFFESFKENIDQDEVIHFIWGLLYILETDFFGRSPLDPKAPVGIAKITDHSSSGQALFSKNVFFNQRIFEDASFFKSAMTQKYTPISPSIALIYRNKRKNLYLGNTLELKDTSKKAYVTIGLNINHLVQRLALASNQKAALVYSGKLISLFNENGEIVKKPGFFKSALLSSLRDTMGSFCVDGKNYSFSNLKPFPKIPLHFFTFESREKAYWFLHDLKGTTTKVVKNISYQMRIVAVVALFLALIILHFIARKIIRPIAMISKASGQVAEGKFDEVQLPDVAESRHDEVVSLLHSFKKMVKDLREREKVRGVLNKVVSKQIAEEILKGDIHLGGEERELTIFFADIRSFTKMTEKMKPHEVIEMLNSCMTKITKVIDEMEGVIDKYVGDEVMALFGAPVYRKDHALRAIRTAIKIREEFKKYNEERRSQNLPEIHLGIGIHTGMVVAGNMGAENRLNYTVLGSNVNLAARLCSYAKSEQILVSQKTLDSHQTKNSVKAHQLEAHQFEGFSGETQVYEIMNVT